ncbi:hypothetical protein [Pseudozobellia thermophila]|uniref:Ferritin-like metal-binding protein YciE n=1 Tax=Pseudozobellia thermophila TaxID=192903 RepID=A0A1M6IJI6_9FLAO|nr:hypothetical protein [Pseudozobellia thermophila]SHJ34553.1 hypothetical protein SAMN04488513_1047 [Pseudozobellia thermophila]
MNDTKFDKDLEFLKDGPWDELSALTSHWKSDLEFYRDDLRFLHHLTDKYFMWITKQENLDMVKELKQGLFELGTMCTDLLAKVNKHLVQLGRLVENPNEADAGIIKTEHEHLEGEMSQFVKAFRDNRKEVFAITEYVVDSEQLASIMGN